MTDAHPELPGGPDASGPVAHRRPRLLLLVGVGGSVGTLTRVWIADALPTRSMALPWATLIVNVVGAFVLGVLLESLARSGPDRGWRMRARLLVGTGFCGGLTTYSTFAIEVDLLANGGHWLLALAYGFGSVIAGMAAAAAGIAVATTTHDRVVGRT